MTQNLIVVDGADSGPFRIKTYAISDGGFTEAGATTSQTGWAVDRSQDFAVSADAIYLSAGASSPLRSKIWCSEITNGIAGEPFELDTDIFGGATNISAQCLDLNGDVLAVGFNTGSYDHLYILSTADASILWSGNLPAGIDVRSVVWVSSTRLAVINGTSGQVSLWSWDGSTLTELTNSGATNYGVHLSKAPGRRVWGIGAGSIALLDFTGDTITLVDSLAGTYGTNGPSQALDSSLPQRDIELVVTGDTISEAQTYSSGSATQSQFAISPTHWVGAERAYNTSETISAGLRADGSILGTVNPDATTSIRSFKFIPATEVPSDQEAFEAAYADVSGRDPLPTALQQRTPARQLVNYLVSMYRYNPRIVTYALQVELGELEKTSPAPAAGDLGRFVWIQDEREPEFVSGRWAQILGRSGGAEPGTVRLTLRIDDNPLAFIKEP